MLALLLQVRKGGVGDVGVVLPGDNALPRGGARARGSALNRWRPLRAAHWGPGLARLPDVIGEDLERRQLQCGGVGAMLPFLLEPQQGHHFQKLEQLELGVLEDPFRRLFPGLRVLV